VNAPNLLFFYSIYLYIYILASKVLRVCEVRNLRIPKSSKAVRLRLVASTSGKGASAPSCEKSLESGMGISNCSATKPYFRSEDCTSPFSVNTVLRSMRMHQKQSRFWLLAPLASPPLPSRELLVVAFGEFWSGLPLPFRSNGFGSESVAAPSAPSGGCGKEVGGTPLSGPTLTPSSGTSVAKSTGLVGTKFGSAGFISGVVTSLVIRVPPPLELPPPALGRLEILRQLVFTHALASVQSNLSQPPLAPETQA